MGHKIFKFLSWKNFGVCYTYIFTHLIFKVWHSLCGWNLFFLNSAFFGHLWFFIYFNDKRINFFDIYNFIATYLENLALLACARIGTNQILQKKRKWIAKIKLDSIKNCRIKNTIFFPIFIVEYKNQQSNLEFRHFFCYKNIIFD